jgi:hypothetical protein
MKGYAGCVVAGFGGRERRGMGEKGAGAGNRYGFCVYLARCCDV